MTMHNLILTAARDCAPLSNALCALRDLLNAQRAIELNSLEDCVEALEMTTDALAEIRCAVLDDARSYFHSHLYAILGAALDDDVPPDEAFEGVALDYTGTLKGAR